MSELGRDTLKVWDRRMSKSCLDHTNLRNKASKPSSAGILAQITPFKYRTGVSLCFTERASLAAVPICGTRSTMSPRRGFLEVIVGSHECFTCSSISRASSNEILVTSTGRNIPCRLSFSSCKHDVRCLIYAPLSVIPYLLQSSRPLTVLRTCQ